MHDVSYEKFNILLDVTLSCSEAGVTAGHEC